MLQALLRILSAVAKLFVGIFARSSQQPEPEPTPQPSGVPTTNPGPSPTPTPPPPAPAPPPAVIVPQSAWWHGAYKISQPYGPSDFGGEPHNPNHPQYPHWHDGIDFAMPMGTPLYAGRDCYVVAVGIVEFGTSDPAALILWTGQHDIWLLHLNDQVGLHHGQLVRTGTLLGHSGTRGNSTGPHLHFQVNPHGGNYQSDVDPHPWLIPWGMPGAATN